MGHVADVIHHSNKRRVWAMKIIIDRFEGDYAVVELPNMFIVDMPKQLVPEGAKEGDVLIIEVDVAETESRREKIERMMDDLWE